MVTAWRIIWSFGFGYLNTIFFTVNFWEERYYWIGLHYKQFGFKYQSGSKWLFFELMSLFFWSCRKYNFNSMFESRLKEIKMDFKINRTSTFINISRHHIQVAMKVYGVHMGRHYFRQKDRASVSDWISHYDKWDIFIVYP